MKFKKYNSKEHKIKTKEGFVYNIDDLKILGTDGMLPQNEYKSFKILYKGKEINLPKEYYQNLYNINIDSIRLTYNKSLNQYYLFGSFSDRAGSYDAVWVMENGKIIKNLAQNPFYI